MYAVLLVPSHEAVDRGATALAATVGGAAYDHRQSLLRGLPWLLAWDEDAARTRARAATLREAGVTAWPISAAALDLVPQVSAVRSFAWTAEGLQCTDRQTTWSLAWPQVRLVLPCRAELGRAVSETTTTRKVGLAQMAMGLPIARKQTTSEQWTERDQAFFALLWAAWPSQGAQAGGEVLLRWDAEALDYAGLGALKTASSTRNYQAVLEHVRRHAAMAWDPRLERAGSRIAPVVLPAESSQQRPDRKTTVSTRVAAWNNQDAVVQAAQLLILAARLQQTSRPAAPP
jgi:hypothetical protein